MLTVREPPPIPPPDAETGEPAPARRKPGGTHALAANGEAARGEIVAFAFFSCASNASVFACFGTSGGVAVSDPSAARIEEVLAALPGGMDSFAIIAKSELTYMQAAGGPAAGFVLEYQAGSIDHHYWSVRDDLPLGTVTQAFQLYATGDESWQSLATWEKKEISGTFFGVLPIALVTLALLGALLWWWRAA